MEEPSPLPASPVPSGTSPGPSSLLSRLLNVFAVPGEVFEEVKATRTTVAGWLVPILIYGAVTAVSSFLLLSQPAIAQKMHEQQEKALEERVKAGKMTRQQADQAMEINEKISGPVAKTGGVIGGFVMAFIIVFWWAFLSWLISRFILGTPVSFMKLVEVMSLASAISILGTLVRMLLGWLLSNPMASINLALLLKNPDPKNGLFGLLSMVDLITFWMLIVRSIGLAKLAGTSVSRAAVWIFGIWAVLTLTLIGISVAVQKALGA